MGSHFVFLRLLGDKYYLANNSELANQRARKALFTCVVYTKCRYF